MNTKLKIQQPDFKFSAGFFLFIILINTGKTLGQVSPETDTLSCIRERNDIPGGRNYLKITSMGFGGMALKISKINNQFAIMNGGRGSVTINRRYTIGGGGYGVVNRINLGSSNSDPCRFFKMGYGGLELGYILYPGQKLNIGSSLLIAAGAAFTETVPKTKDKNFKLFPVLEPSFYAEVGLSRMIRFQAGVTYRYINGTKLDYISDRSIRGFSFYINLLFGTCGCN